MSRTGEVSERKDAIDRCIAKHNLTVLKDDGHVAPTCRAKLKSAPVSRPPIEAHCPQDGIDGARRRLTCRSFPKRKPQVLTKAHSKLYT
jgi:hypothetical protein